MTNTDIYARQSFGQSTGLGNRPALLVIDFVNGFNDPEILGGGNIDAAVKATVPLLAHARARGVPVIFTRIVYAEDGSDAGLWCEKVPRLRELTETAAASQVVGELAPQGGELIIRKTQASAFFDTTLAAQLAYRGIDSLVMVGCTTSGCVRASAIDAMSNNIRSVVVSDCVGDRALEPHAANLFDIGQKYADLMSAEQVMSIL
ncbi:isochorismatase family protein [Nitratireductor sp. CAU 1489]|uniref:Isochorismatase family protein n=1 Tax=Nitratireductor arenosus TaxID=2682096 RepID=A0A844QJM2_9HYPH|nr:isochorismatase family protein [Nitratireductor arenosus]MVA99782.1 isochorismatase family protein [Nitratireductor arenosus]